jgi:hypothetical protein
VGHGLDIIQPNKGAMQYLTICVLGVGSMDDAVDRVMPSYESLPALERLGREEIRTKVGEYLAKLSSAGHGDAEELTFYGLAYLRFLHEGQIFAIQAAERPEPPQLTVKQCGL